MRRHLALGESDRAAYSATIAFLSGRLEEIATIEWALRLKPSDGPMRAALLDLIDSVDGLKIGEPWQSCWRLIEESWTHDVPEVDHASGGSHFASWRIAAGDRSRALIQAIVELVAPRLTVTPLSDWQRRHRTPARRPKRIEDLLSASLRCRETVDPSVLKLDGISDVAFLLSLARALESALVDGLDIARRTGWDGSNDWVMHFLNRVYFVPKGERSGSEHEPDEFGRGISPSVKLLHYVVSLLIEADLKCASEFLRRWRTSECPVRIRLWAAMSRDPRVTSGSDVAEFLDEADDEQFWNVHRFPEVAELRARRFKDLESVAQDAVSARIRKRPPRQHWSRTEPKNDVEAARTYQAVRELRRIEIAGGTLEVETKAHLEASLSEFPDLARMKRLDEGFLSTPKAEWVAPTPDKSFDHIEGEERLAAIEGSIKTTRRSWNDDPAKNAADWMADTGNASKVLTDLESRADAGAAFAGVWKEFCIAHARNAPTDPALGQQDCDRVLALLRKLPEATIASAIHGISSWLSAWGRQLVRSTGWTEIWRKLWPLAVAATNAQQAETDAIHLNVAGASNDGEPMDIDTYNTPAGILVGVFLNACPSVKLGERPFDKSERLRHIRDTIVAERGRSSLIAKHRLIEEVDYFAQTAPDWTRDSLIPPLLLDNDASIPLWRAVGRKTRRSAVLKIIGQAMCERAVDQRLGRETRESLMFSLIVECLLALHEGTEPAIPYLRVQQTIRSLDDEVRGRAADALRQFVQDVSAPRTDGTTPPSTELLFRSAIRPFLQDVWPQERSLTSSSVSRALANLTANAGGAFAEAVQTVDRFLVPFECWSLIDYGFFRREGDIPDLSRIDTPEKATALLRLLDLTIGHAEISVIPFDLSNALAQIRSIDRGFEADPAYRRLATAARRHVN
jgi:hypothetical protein